MSLNSELVAVTQPKMNETRLMAKSVTFPLSCFLSWIFFCYIYLFISVIVLRYHRCPCLLAEGQETDRKQKCFLLLTLYPEPLLLLNSLSLPGRRGRDGLKVSLTFLEEWTYWCCAGLKHETTETLGLERGNYQTFWACQNDSIMQTKSHTAASSS